MKIFKDDKCREFSDEVLTQLAIMSECVYAAEIIAYRMSRILDSQGVKGTVFQNRKQALNNARRGLDSCLHCLEQAFDVQVFERATGDDASRAEALHYQANDVIQVLLLYFSRCDEAEGKRDAIKKMLRRFKQNPGLDIESVLDYYRVK